MTLVLLRRPTYVYPQCKTCDPNDGVNEFTWYAKKVSTYDTGAQFADSCKKCERCVAERRQIQTTPCQADFPSMCVVCPRGTYVQDNGAPP